MQSVGVWKNIPLQTELIMRSHNESLIRFLGVMVNEAGCFLANLAAFYCIYCCSAGDTGVVIVIKGQEAV